ncbi:MAG: acetyl-CoA carboxylase carboxyl transferase subunit beta [Actinobacteria bacterium]|nr:acetyl-CoA carboxylase carboxyl transferase subunit beta [Actinomycetota bacterium]
MIKCSNCKIDLDKSSLEANYFMCPNCEFHFPMPALNRIAMIADDNASIKEIGTGLRSSDPLKFVDVRPYPERLLEAVDQTSLEEAIVVVECQVGGMLCVLAVMDFGFMGGSMGAVVGEKFVLATEHSIKKNTPLIVFTASGGARMQEGIISLMQMSKTLMAVLDLSRNRIPFITVLTHPTTGGVYASFATQADIILSEPDILACFAGPRVIKQTIGRDLPEDFGTPDFCFAAGHIDKVVKRKDLRYNLVEILSLFRGAIEIGRGKTRPLPEGDRQVRGGIGRIKKITALAWRTLGRFYKKIIGQN